MQTAGRGGQTEEPTQEGSFRPQVTSSRKEEARLSTPEPSDCCRMNDRTSSALDSTSPGPFLAARPKKRTFFQISHEEELPLFATQMTVFHTPRKRMRPLISQRKKSPVEGTRLSRSRSYDHLHSPSLCAN